jgi:hypothetical protein
MKIKGSRKLKDYEIPCIKHSLRLITIREGKCTGIFCTSCIFSSYYAEDEGACANNSVFKGSKNNLEEYFQAKVKRAKEILDEFDKIEDVNN